METNGLLVNVYQWLPGAEQQRRDGQQTVWALFAGLLKCSISCLQGNFHRGIYPSQFKYMYTLNRQSCMKVMNKEKSFCKWKQTNHQIKYVMSSGLNIDVTIKMVFNCW